MTSSSLLSGARLFAPPPTEAQMRVRPDSRKNGSEPKRRQRHYSYDESVNESAKLIEDEPVDIEHKAPADENQSEQSVEPDETSPFLVD
jgi:hypothetical protein